MVRKLLKKITSEERGAIQVIEMTLVFPIVIVLLGFLIYVGMYILTSVTIYNNAQFIAVTAAKELTFPGYAKFFPDPGSGTVSTRVDIALRADQDVPNIINVSSIFEEHNPYRYFQSGNKMLGANTYSLEARLKKLIMQTAFLGGSAPEVSITAQQQVVRQVVIVDVKKTLFLPKYLEFIGLSGASTIHVQAKATANNPAEFVRTIDLVEDTIEWFFEDTKPGSKLKDQAGGIFETIKPYIDKLNKAMETLGLKGG